ncbi:MAG: sensor histidine kinase [Vicinamibacteraceae bacterium]
MTPDGLAPDAAAHDSTPPGVRTWRRDVIDGVTRRFALAALPALVLALVARAVRGDWDQVALIAVTLTATATTLSHRLSPRARVGVIVSALVWTNAFVMVYGRQIPFHGTLIPLAASFAALMGGARWGWWTLGLTSATWLIPWVLAMVGAPPLFDIAWSSQYLRLWFFLTSLTAGIVATITHVTRHLEASIEHSDALLERVRAEARAVQALAGRVREAEEDERRRLARDLHDDFGQRLTALRMKLQLFRLRPDQRTAAIDDCVTISEELLHDVRAFARGLRPPLLDEVGLGPALHALVDAHVDRAAFVVTVDVPERLPRLPPSIELAAYRVVQEALANVLRHAAASRLSLAARRDGGELAVWVIDDGRGFDPGQATCATPGQHLGLVSMRERAEFAGGSLEVDSAPGRGTTVCLRIPLAAAAPAGSGHEPAVAS